MYPSRVRGSTQGPTGDLKLFRKARPYIIAAVAVTIATVLRLAMVPVLGWEAVPFITYFIAVIATALFCGVRSGATAGILSAAAAGYLFVRHPSHLFPAGTSSFASLPAFALSVAVLLYMVHTNQRTAEQLRRSEQECSKRLEELDAIYPEPPCRHGSVDQGLVLHSRQ